MRFQLRILASLLAIALIAIFAPTAAEEPLAERRVDRNLLYEPIEPLSIESATRLLKLSGTEPVTFHLSQGGLTGAIRVTNSSNDQRLLDNFLKNNRVFTENPSVVALEGSDSQFREPEQLRQQMSDPVQGEGFTQVAQTVAMDPSLCTAVNSDVGPTLPPDWEPNYPTEVGLVQSRSLGITETATIGFEGVGQDDQQWPCTRRPVDSTQGAFKIQSRYALEMDYKVDQCDTSDPYVLSDPPYAWMTNVPMAYIDTRADDSDCVLDFTIGTVAPYLMDKSVRYSSQIYTHAPTYYNQPASSSARGRLNAEILAINLPGGCELNEYPAGQITATPDPWCVNVWPSGEAARAATYIKIPDFVVQASSTCYKASLGAGYTWCSSQLDPN